jgi:hypothetical protein
MASEKCLAFALYTGGRSDLKGRELAACASAVGVSLRTAYRYLDAIARAKFLLKDRIGEKS